MEQSLIDKANVLKGLEELKQSPFVNSHDSYVRHMMREALDVVAKLVIEAEPTVEPKHGKWEICAEAPTYSQKLICSICRVELPLTIVDEYGDMLPYCPNCGAKMDGEDNAVSFNGRTRGFDPCDAGSIPAAATNQMESEEE